MGSNISTSFAFRFSKRRKHSLFRSGLIFSRFRSKLCSDFPGCHSALCLVSSLGGGDNHAQVTTRVRWVGRAINTVVAPTFCEPRFSSPYAHTSTSRCCTLQARAHTHDREQPRVAFGHTTHVCTASERAHARVQRRPSTTSQLLLQRPGQRPRSRQPLQQR